MSILSGVTHAIVTVPVQSDAKQTGTRALVALCYGPGDANAISNIRLQTVENGVEWQVPHVEVFENGQQMWVPVFRGELLEKLCQTAARALERVKEQIGTPQWNTRYRVYATPDGTSKVETL
jgi:hypothetical protein